MKNMFKLLLLMFVFYRMQLRLLLSKVIGVWNNMFNN
jgi:hypothetical protein